LEGTYLPKLREKLSLISIKNSRGGKAKVHRFSKNMFYLVGNQGKKLTVAD